MKVVLVGAWGAVVLVIRRGARSGFGLGRSMHTNAPCGACAEGGGKPCSVSRLPSNDKRMPGQRGGVVVRKIRRPGSAKGSGRALLARPGRRGRAGSIPASASSCVRAGDKFNEAPYKTPPRRWQLGGGLWRGRRTDDPTQALLSKSPRLTASNRRHRSHAHERLSTARRLPRRHHAFRTQRCREPRERGSSTAEP